MDKILLVTGASSDVGIELIKDIYMDYKCIYIHYYHMNDKLLELIEILGGETEIVPIQADFSSESSVQELIDKIIDKNQIPNSIVHLPSTKVYSKKFHKDDIRNFDVAWNVSVKSILQILKAFMPYMVKGKYGRIVFMLTSNTIDKPAKYQASYTTVKYALLGLMKSLSVEYIDKGITVNGVSPDMMETKFLSEMPELIIQNNASNSPIGRNVYICEVVPMIRHMLSDLGASMTGQNIAITGGL